MKKRAFVVLAIVVVLVLYGAVTYASPDCSCGDYSISLFSATKLNDGNVKWVYEVEASGGKDISHVDVALSECYEVVSCGPQPCEVVDDPTTGIYGVKWEGGVDVGDTAYLWFVTASDTESRHGDVQSAVKAGQLVCYYVVDGPVCAPNSVTLSGMNAHRELSDHGKNVARFLAILVTAFILAFVVAVSKKI